MCHGNSGRELAVFNQEDRVAPVDSGMLCIIVLTYLILK